MVKAFSSFLILYTKKLVYHGGTSAGGQGIDDTRKRGVKCHICVDLINIKIYHLSSEYHSTKLLVVLR